MTDTKLPRYNRKTTLRVKVVDKSASIGITVGGLGVILAVLGLIVFIGWQVIPLFLPSSMGEPTPAHELGAGDTLVLHTDEFRRVGVRITKDGYVTSFALATGEVLSREKPPELGNGTLTAAKLSLRPRTTRNVGSSMDVPHYHLLLGTSDGRVLVGELTYLIAFVRFSLEEDPGELGKLKKPEESAFKSYGFVPEIVIKDKAVIEHVNSYGLYRSVQAQVSILRELDVPTGGNSVRLVYGQINDADARASRTTTTVVITGDNRTLLVREEISVNRMTGKLRARAETRDLTDEIAGVPDWALVNELQTYVVLVARDGFVHFYQYENATNEFTQPYPAFSVFAAQADTDLGQAWHMQVNELREDEGYEPIPGEPHLTAVSFLLGDETIVFGDSAGGLQSWFTVKDTKRDSLQVWNRYTRIRSLAPSPQAIASIHAAQLNKSALVVDEGGSVRAINNTAERLFVDTQAEGVRTAVFAPKGDGLLAIGPAGRVHHWWLEAPHSDVSFKSLFGAVWYEGFDDAGYEWQSSSATDDVEPKLSLIPLIAGTIKGALYALLFAVPLAVLAAIYTSEFMHRNMRSILKPTMEVMASLPSVVLGFLAALYFAPKAAPMMPAILCALIIVPGVFMVFGWVWQRCPPSFVGKFGYWRSTALLFALLAIGLALSVWTGPRVEPMLFPAVEGANPALLDPVTFKPLNESAELALDTGDFRTWTGGGRKLDRETEITPILLTDGTQIPGGRLLPKGWWLPGGHNLFIALMTIPLALLIGFGARFAIRKTTDGDGETVMDRLRGRLEGSNRHGARAVLVDIGVSIAFGAVVLAIGFGISCVISPVIESILFSYDHPTAGTVADFRHWITRERTLITGERGWTFEQSNSLIVGFAMGFAVIPLIYTISEDALTTVPNQLRAASLACGASRWQTTMRVVMPAAISGIFSAIVIGLGRALGETMIVVMAAGGTPVVEMQPLSGFRSLSAAIAIEMPEAPHEGSLYRTLFLSGLVLFLMAFVINTMAEVVRMRLRKRLSRL